MTRRTSILQGLNILILEDDYYLATDLRNALEDVGAHVIGPFSDVAEAGRALEAKRPDCALVDVNLGHGPSFELPKALRGLDVPFAFVTGYDTGAIPAEFDTVERLQKPVEVDRLVGVTGRLLGKGTHRPPAASR